MVEEKKRDETIRAAARQLIDCPDPNRRSPPHSTGRPTGRRSNNQGSPGRGPTGRHPTRKQQQPSTGRFTGRRNDNQGSPGRGQTGRHPSWIQQHSTGRFSGRRSSNQGSPGRGQSGRHPTREQKYSTSRTDCRLFTKNVWCIRPTSYLPASGQADRRLLIKIRLVYPADVISSSVKSNRLT